MTPGYAKIVKCPFCGAKKELMTLNSANSIRSQYWSDTKIISPMHPTVSPVQKCPKCGKYYLEYKQKTQKTNKYSTEDGKLSYWEWKEAYTQFCTTDNDIKKGWKHLFQKKKSPFLLDKEDWVNVRGWFLQSYNDCFYRCPVEKEPTKEDRDLIVGVIKNLIETIDWGDTNTPLFPFGVTFGSPEEEEVWTSAKNPLWKAELYREANEFEKCTEILLSIDYNRLDEFQKRLYDEIKKRMEKKEVKVFKYYNDYEERHPISNHNDEFRNCPNGRFYTGGIPYPCYSPNPRESHKKKGCFSSHKRNTFIIKVCTQGHGYDEKESVCPFCGDDTVLSTHEVSVAHSLCITNLFFEKEGLPLNINKASVDGATISGKICLEVYHTLLYKYKYLIVDGKGNRLIVFPNSNVTLIGEDFSDSFSGREFIKICDSLFSKQQKNKQTNHYITKVCPQGHGYNVFDSCCPFCGESKIGSIYEDTASPTIWYSDFFYEKEGNPIHDLEASVDGASLNGEIRLRVYHVSTKYKYKYCVVDKQGRELIVLPENKVVLSGNGFSDTFIGRGFYKMCDELFEKTTNK